MDTLVSLRVFRQVVESGGFTAAARVLDMSVAMVSKHIQHLEQHLGTRLLQRTSRKVALNEPGARFYERCCEILDQLDEAENSLGKAMGRPSGVLRITAPSWFANPFFARVLRGYREAYPEVELEISLSDAMVDLADEGLDLALRVMHRAQESISQQKVMALEFVMVASSDYLDRRGRPTSLEDLRGHEMLVYSYMPAEQFTFPWNRAGWRLNNTNLIAKLALEGAGIAILPRLILQELSGPLETLHLPAQLPSPSLYLVTHGRRHQSPRVRSFMEFFRTGCCPQAR